MVKQSTKSKAKSTAKKPAAKAVKATKKVTKAPVKKTVKASAKAPIKKTTTKATTKKTSRLAFLRRNTSVKSTSAGAPRTRRLPFVAPRNWNGWLAALYAAQGVAILIASKTFLVPVTLTYLAGDALASKAATSPVLSPAIQHLFDLNLAYALAGLLFVLAFVHAVVATVGRKAYNASVETTASSVRWVVSFLSVGGSLALVGLVIGIRDVVSLLALIAFVLLSTMAAFVVELLSRDKVGAIHKTFLYRLHFIGYFAPLVALAIYLVGASIYDGQLPVFTTWLFASTVVISFFLTNVLRMQLAAEGKWANYAYAERAYLLGAFVLVTSVVWQIFAGLLTK